ncbi:cyclase family protein [Methanobrevibacter sp. DSM 116169]|uniref:cyclase family protein n=1 Tax=Methanobrevibacter sp. DSM 116169 TaxID=3242727 RepID=UPI0038FBF8EA
MDLTQKLDNNLNVFPGDPEFKIANFKLPDNDKSYINNISGGLHSGTHIDAPLHYIKNGKMVSALKLDNLIGKSSILECSSNEKEIHIEKVKNPLEKIVIIKTSWCDNFNSDEYFTNNPYLSYEFTESLLEKNIQGIAIDTPSVDKYGKSEIHELLLENNIWIVENLTNTEKLVKKEYNSYFIPMKIASEASFIRAFVEK